MTDLLQVFMLSMAPIGEAKLSVPLGILFYNLNPVSVFFIAILGNFLPPLFLLLFLKKISVYLSARSKTFLRIFSWWENKAGKEHLENSQKYGMIGLILFIIAPLPFTGAWTASLLATMMNLPLRKSIPAVLIGVAISVLTITMLVVLGVSIEEYFGWPMLIIFLIILTLIYIIWKLLNKKWQATT